MRRVARCCAVGGRFITEYTEGTEKEGRDDWVWWGIVGHFGAWVGRGAAGALPAVEAVELAVSAGELKLPFPLIMR